MIKLDIKIGDTILTGKWKNKKVVVKSIGTDEYGSPTINGKSILKIRIPKLYERKHIKNIKLKSLLKETTYPNYMDGYTKSTNPIKVLKITSDCGKYWLDIYYSKSKKDKDVDMYYYYLILKGYFRAGAMIPANDNKTAIESIWRSLEKKLNTPQLTNVEYFNKSFPIFKELINKLKLYTKD